MKIKWKREEMMVKVEGNHDFVDSTCSSGGSSCPTMESCQSERNIDDSCVNLSPDICVKNRFTNDKPVPGLKCPVVLRGLISDFGKTLVRPRKNGLGDPSQSFKLNKKRLYLNTLLANENFTELANLERQEGRTDDIRKKDQGRQPVDMTEEHGAISLAERGSLFKPAKVGGITTMSQRREFEVGDEKVGMDSSVMPKYDNEGSGSTRRSSRVSNYSENTEYKRFVDIFIKLSDEGSNKEMSEENSRATCAYCSNVTDGSVFSGSSKRSPVEETHMTCTKRGEELKAMNLYDSNDGLSGIGRGTACSSRCISDRSGRSDAGNRSSKSSTTCASPGSRGSSTSEASNTSFVNLQHLVFTALDEYHCTSSTSSLSGGDFTGFTSSFSIPASSSTDSFPSSTAPSSESSAHSAMIASTVVSDVAFPRVSSSDISSSLMGCGGPDCHYSTDYSDASGITCTTTAIEHSLQQTLTASNSAVCSRTTPSQPSSIPLTDFSAIAVTSACDRSSLVEHLASSNLVGSISAADLFGSDARPSASTDRDDSTFLPPCSADSTSRAASAASKNEPSGKTVEPGKWRERTYPMTTGGHDQRRKDKDSESTLNKEDGDNMSVSERLWMYCTDAVIQMYCDEWEIVDWAYPLLDYLHSANYRLALCTNSKETHKQNALIADKLQDRALLFDPIVLSGNIGLKKPDPRVMSMICKTWNINPLQVVVVGDLLDKDVLGAQSIRATAVWFPSHAVDWKDIRGNEGFLAKVVAYQMLYPSSWWRKAPLPSHPFIPSPASTVAASACDASLLSSACSRLLSLTSLASQARCPLHPNCHHHRSHHHHHCPSCVTPLSVRPSCPHSFLPTFNQHHHHHVVHLPHPTLSPHTETVAPTGEGESNSLAVEPFELKYCCNCFSPQCIPSAFAYSRGAADVDSLSPAGGAGGDRPGVMRRSRSYPVVSEVSHCDALSVSSDHDSTTTCQDHKSCSDFVVGPSSNIGSLRAPATASAERSCWPGSSSSTAATSQRCTYVPFSVDFRIAHLCQLPSLLSVIDFFLQELILHEQKIPPLTLYWIVSRGRRLSIPAVIPVTTTPLVVAYLLSSKKSSSIHPSGCFNSTREIIYVPIFAHLSIACQLLSLSVRPSLFVCKATFALSDPISHRGLLAELRQMRQLVTFADSLEAQAQTVDRRSFLCLLHEACETVNATWTSSCRHPTVRTARFWTFSYNSEPHAPKQPTKVAGSAKLLRDSSPTSPSRCSIETSRHHSARDVPSCSSSLSPDYYLTHSVAPHLTLVTSTSGSKPSPNPFRRSSASYLSDPSKGAPKFLFSALNSFVPQSSYPLVVKRRLCAGNSFCHDMALVATPLALLTHLTNQLSFMNCRPTESDTASAIEEASAGAVKNKAEAREGNMKTYGEGPRGDDTKQCSSASSVSVEASAGCSVVTGSNYLIQLRTAPFDSRHKENNDCEEGTDQTGGREDKGSEEKVWQELRSQLVVEEYIRHGGLVYKVYVMGDFITVCCRPSFPSVPSQAATGSTGHAQNDAISASLCVSSPALHHSHESVSVPGESGTSSGLPLIAFSQSPASCTSVRLTESAAETVTSSSTAIGCATCNVDTDRHGYCNTEGMWASNDEQSGVRLSGSLSERPSPSPSTWASSSIAESSYVAACSSWSPSTSPASMAGTYFGAPCPTLPSSVPSLLLPAVLCATPLTASGLSSATPLSSDDTTDCGPVLSATTGDRNLFIECGVWEQLTSPSVVAFLNGRVDEEDQILYFNSNFVKSSSKRDVGTLAKAILQKDAKEVPNSTGMDCRLTEHRVAERSAAPTMRDVKGVLYTTPEVASTTGPIHPHSVENNNTDQMIVTKAVDIREYGETAPSTKTGDNGDAGFSEPPEHYCRGLGSEGVCDCCKGKNIDEWLYRDMCWSDGPESSWPGPARTQTDTQRNHEENVGFRSCKNRDRRSASVYTSAGNSHESDGHQRAEAPADQTCGSDLCSYCTTEGRDREGKGQDHSDPRLDKSTIMRLAHKISEKLGSRLFGFDLVVEETSGDYVVLDLNHFPGYGGVRGLQDMMKSLVERRVSESSHCCK
eukprot:GHVQ01023872.1.p1 GENE.GHVQ01023872.1~~GHVQ01023872.1.p1  ORF type:complete len:2063 (-),score=265.83 GHVQ01023872.1:450-6638(-)